MRCYERICVALECRVTTSVEEGLECGGNGFVADLLLNAHARGGEHSEATVLQLLGLHLGKLLGGAWLQSKGVKSNVPGVVVVPEETSEGSNILSLASLLSFLEGSLLRRHPARESAAGLADANGDRQRKEELGSNLLNLSQVGVGWARNLASEERVEALADEVADGCHHGDAAVGDLGLAEAFHLLQRQFRSKAKGVKLSDRVEGTRETIAEFCVVGSPTYASDVPC